MAYDPEREIEVLKSKISKMQQDDVEKTMIAKMEAMDEEHKAKMAQLVAKMEEMEKPKDNGNGKSKMDGDDVEDDDVVKALLKMAQGEEVDEDTAKGLMAKIRKMEGDASAVGRYDIEEEHDLPDDEMKMEGDEEGLPESGRILKNYYRSVAATADQLEKEGKMAENPEVSDFLGKESDALKSRLTEIEGLFSKNYPDASPLSAEEAPPEGEGGDEAMKTWLRSSNRHEFKALGVAAKMKAIMSDRRASRRSRALAGDAYKTLKEIVQQAKEVKPTEGGEDTERMEKLMKELQGFKRELADSTPAQ